MILQKYYNCMTASIIMNYFVFMNELPEFINIFLCDKKLSANLERLPV